MLWLKKNLAAVVLAMAFLVLSSCDKYYVAVSQQWVDVRYLASTHVKTPDPRQDHPPIGQMVIIDWRVPKELLKKKPHVQLTMILWDYTEKIVCFPIDKRMGWATYKLLDEQYDATGGILTYKAEILSEDGAVFREWKHQLWVNLITLNEETQLPESDQEKEEHREEWAD